MTSISVTRNAISNFELLKYFDDDKMMVGAKNGIGENINTNSVIRTFRNAIISYNLFPVSVTH